MVIRLHTEEDKERIVREYLIEWGIDPDEEEIDPDIDDDDFDEEDDDDS